MGWWKKTKQFLGLAPEDKVEGPSWDQAAVDAEAAKQQKITDDNQQLLDWRKAAVDAMFEGANTAQDIASQYGQQSAQALSAYDANMAEGAKQMRSEASQALAGGQAAVGGTMGGGGGYGALIQAGSQLGKDAAAFQKQGALDRTNLQNQLFDRASQAKLDAIAAMAGANQYAFEQGTESDWNRDMLSEVESIKANITAQVANQISGEQRAAARLARSQAAYLPEPARSELLAWANDVENGYIDV